jgi:hypothetical protein
MCTAMARYPSSLVLPKDFGSARVAACLLQHMPLLGQ